jgi:hypothetical protein
MNIVTIKEVKGVVTCAEDGTSEHVFNVKNATQKALKVGMQLSLDGPTSAEWLQIDGSSEHDLAVETMTQVSVKIKTPSDCAPGKYSYRLRVYDPANPGEDYTDGDPVYFEVLKKKVVVPQKEESGKKPFKWWIPVAIAAGMVVIGVVIWLVWPSKAPDITVPRFTGSSFSAALQRISSSGLSFNDQTDLKIVKVNREDQHEKVLSQDPPQGQQVPPNSAVKLTVGRFVKKKFVIKNLPKVKSMKGIKMSSGFIKREVEPAPE